MSYILDALRKAEAQRSRSTGQDMSSGVSPSWLVDGAAGLPTRQRTGPWVWALGLCGILGALAVAALLLSPSGWLPAQPPAASVMPSTPAPVSEPSPSPASASATPHMTTPTPAAPASATATATAAGVGAAPRASASPLPAASVKTTAPEGPAGGAAAPAAPLDWSRVPEPMRRLVPAINGFMYSPDPQARMLLVNGQVVREGDALAPGVVLVRIRQNGALLNVQDQPVWWTP